MTFFKVLSTHDFLVAIGIGAILGVILSGALTPHIQVSSDVTAIKPSVTPEPVYVTQVPTATQSTTDQVSPEVQILHPIAIDQQVQSTTTPVNVISITIIFSGILMIIYGIFNHPPKL